MITFLFCRCYFSFSVFVMFLIKWPMVKETFYLCLTCLIYFILLLNCIGSIISWLKFCCNGKNCTKWIFHVIIEKKKRKRNMHCDRSLLYCVSIDGFVHKFVHLLRIIVPCSCVFFYFVTVNSCFSFFFSLFYFWTNKTIALKCQTYYIKFTMFIRYDGCCLAPISIVLSCMPSFQLWTKWIPFSISIPPDFQAAHIWWCVLPKTMHFNRF